MTWHPEARDACLDLTLNDDRGGLVHDIRWIGLMDITLCPQCRATQRRKPTFMERIRRRFMGVRANGHRRAVVTIHEPDQMERTMGGY